MNNSFKINKKKYISCPLVEHAFMFDQNNCLRVCSMINNEGGGRPLFQDNYHGEILDWDKIFAQKREHRKLHREGKILPECVGCQILKEKEWETDGDYIDEMLITHWVNCNSNCSYCPVINDEELKKRTIFYNILPAIKDTIARNVLKKDAKIELAGGESTIHSEFEELLSLFIDNNFTNVIINTSAIKYSKAIENGLRKGNLKVTVSLDSGTKAVHEKIKRVKSYDKVWENLKSYSLAQSEANKTDLITTKYIIVPGENDTIEEIDAFLAKNLEVGIKTVAVNVEICWYQSHIGKDNHKLKDLIKYMIMKTKRFRMNCKVYPQAYWVIK